MYRREASRRALVARCDQELDGRQGARNCAYGYSLFHRKGAQ
jgi:hypothetical protein